MTQNFHNHTQTVWHCAICCRLVLNCNSLVRTLVQTVDFESVYFLVIIAVEARRPGDFRTRRHSEGNNSQLTDEYAFYNTT